MLQGYFDDSGSHGRGIFVLAGYVLPVPKWTKFSVDWAQELAKNPPIRWFKSTEAKSQKGEFEGLTEDVCNRKILDLAQVIRRHGPFCLCTCVEWEDYNDVFSGHLPKEIDNPYFILFYRIIEQALQWQQEYELYEKVDFVFDEQGQLGNIATSFYGFIKSKCREEIREMLGSTPIFRDDKQVVALQAADLIAWQIHRKGSYPDEPRPLLDVITSRGCEKLGKDFGSSAKSVGENDSKKPWPDGK